MPIDDSLDDLQPTRLRRPMPASQNAMEIPSIAGPQMGGVRPAVNLPGVTLPSAQPAAVAAPSIASPQLQKDQAKQVELNKGSGIDQFSHNHHIAGPLLKTLDVLGSVLTPNLARAIPGTTLHHSALVGQNTAATKGDVEQGKEQAETADKQADAAKKTAEAAAAGQPKWTAIPGVTDSQGRILQQEKNSGQMRWAEGVSGAQPLKEPQPHTPNDFQAFYGKYLKDHNAPDNSHNMGMAKKEWEEMSQAPQHDQRQLGVIDGKVVELKPGMSLPAGAQSLSGDLKGHQPTADERKRADLVTNLNENLDQLEEIVKKRPELFGKIAGRMTKAKEFIGSDDPDVAALKGIEDRLGMVQQSSHGMRSAQHVEQSAQSVLNGFKNGDQGMLRAISDARKSGATFTADAARETTIGHAGGGQPQVSSRVPADAPAAPKEDGHKLKDAKGTVLAISKGGKWVSQ